MIQIYQSMFVFDNTLLRYTVGLFCYHTNTFLLYTPLY